MHCVALLTCTFCTQRKQKTMQVAELFCTFAFRPACCPRLSDLCCGSVCLPVRLSAQSACLSVCLPVCLCVVVRLCVVVWPYLAQKNATFGPQALFRCVPLWGCLRQTLTRRGQTNILFLQLSPSYSPWWSCLNCLHFISAECGFSPAVVC